VSDSGWLALTPRDTVFVRDGRSFNAAADSAAQGVIPGPATVAGAVGAAFGREPREVRGPVLARHGAGGWETYFPAPADLVVKPDRRGRHVFRLERASFPGQTDLGAGQAGDGRAPEQWLVPPEHAEPVEPLRGWLPAARLAEYLAGKLPGPRGIRETLLGAEEPLVPERRVGLARDGRTARTGFLYQSTHLRPEDKWAFLAECEYPPGWKRHAAGPVPFGGRGRLADPERATAQWPEHPVDCVAANVVVYLATPAVWRTGWRIPVPDGAQLVAAATGEPEPAATLAPGDDWKKSRALRWAVPAGSVYLLRFGDPEHGAKWAKDIHGTAYGADPEDHRLGTAGFGVVLTGAWT
jgi:CRISPR-associated protein Cmr3